MLNIPLSQVIDLFEFPKRNVDSFNWLPKADVSGRKPFSQRWKDSRGSSKNYSYFILLSPFLQSANLQFYKDFLNAHLSYRMGSFICIRNSLFFLISNLCFKTTLHQFLNNHEDFLNFTSELIVDLFDCSIEITIQHHWNNQNQPVKLERISTDILLFIISVTQRRARLLRAGEAQPRINTLSIPLL